MMAEEQGIKQAAVHNLILEGRKQLFLTGVTDVDSFDEHRIALYTQLGELQIQGKDLHIGSMSIETGEMSVDGEIWAVCYGEYDRKGPLGLFGKLFR